MIARALYEWRWPILCVSVGVVAFFVGRAFGWRAGTIEAAHDVMNVLKALYPDRHERARQLDRLEGGT